MAVVDSLLGLIASQGADGLVLPPKAPPSLEKGGRMVELSMPYPGDEIIAAMVDEVTSPEERERLASGTPVETRYTGSDGKTYSVQIDPRGAGTRMAFRPPGTARPSAARPPARSRAPLTRPVESEPPREQAPPPSEVSTVAAVRSPASALAEATDTPCEPGPLRHVFERAAMDDASDLLFSAGRPARLRVGGAIVELRGADVDDGALRAFVEPALSARSADELARTGSADLAVLVETEAGTTRFRGNLFKQQHGLALALRPVRTNPPTLRGLNLPDELASLAELRNGLVLMTGTTGSGKSTTLVALIEHLNRTTARHVITLEDPIEYEYVPQRALIHQREVGTHVDSFATGLRAALRESPDVILLGEMRDHATIAAALTAAETGHLVLSTLHAGGAPMAVDRMIDVFPEHQQAQVRLQLASVLRAVVTQTLVPTVQPPNRVPAIELLRNTTAVAAKIREGRGYQLQSEIQTGRNEGMIPLEWSLAGLVKQRLIRSESALALANDASALQQYLSSLA
jgi:twitching motility protein PilT